MKTVLVYSRIVVFYTIKKFSEYVWKSKHEKSKKTAIFNGVQFSTQMYRRLKTNPSEKNKKISLHH